PLGEGPRGTDDDRQKRQGRGPRWHESDMRMNEAGADPEKWRRNRRTFFHETPPSRSPVRLSIRMGVCEGRETSGANSKEPVRFADDSASKGTRSLRASV